MSEDMADDTRRDDTGREQTGEHRAPADGDTLPAELDVTAYVGPYLFPTMRRRRVAGAIYAVVALGCLAWWAANDNGGLLVAAVVLGLVAAFHFASAWPLVVDQTEALLIASRTVGFAVGHASAQLAWRG